MSLLLVDLGNSRVKWASAEALAAGEVRDLSHGGSLARLLAHGPWRQQEAPRRLLVVSVCNAEWNESLAAWALRHWGVSAEFLRPRGSGWGVRSAYAPGQLGADRWAALVAARAMEAGPCCVCDCGTALTLDVLDDAGRHRGGLIVPGLAMMRTALGKGTHALDAVGAGGDEVMVRPDAVTTEEGILAGTLYALAAVVARFRDDMGARLGASPRLLLSGGDGRRLLPLLPGEVRYEAQLVLRGALIMAEAS